MNLMSYENTVHQNFIYCSYTKILYIYIYICYKYIIKLIAKSKLIQK